MLMLLSEKVGKCCCVLVFAGECWWILVLDVCFCLTVLLTFSSFWCLMVMLSVRWRISVIWCFLAKVSVCWRMLVFENAGVWWLMLVSLCGNVVMLLSVEECQTAGIWFLCVMWVSDSCIGVNWNSQCWIWFSLWNSILVIFSPTWLTSEGLHYSPVLFDSERTLNYLLS